MLIPIKKLETIIGNMINTVKELTLEEFITQVTNNLNAQKARTEGFIVTINSRLDELKTANGSPSEITRLEGLIVLHTNNLTKLNNTDMPTEAQHRLDEQTRRNDRFNKRINII